MGSDRSDAEKLLAHDHDEQRVDAGDESVKWAALVQTTLGRPSPGLSCYALIHNFSHFTVCSLILS